MRTSEVTKDIAAALAKAQGEMSPAVKDKKNPHFNSPFASLESCVTASRPSLTKNGIAVWQPPFLDEAAGMVRVTTRIEHSSGQFFESTLSARPKDLSPQSIGSAVTYLKRYGYSAMVGLVSDEDDDGNLATLAPGANNSTGANNSKLTEKLKSAPTLELDIPDIASYTPKVGYNRGKPIGQISKETLQKDMAYWSSSNKPEAQEYVACLKAYLNAE